MTRMGQCNRFCGRCCSVTPFLAAYPNIAALYPGVKENGECVHLAWVDGKAECGIYETRPEACRTFPQAPELAAFIPECSYYFIPVGDVEGVRA